MALLFYYQTATTKNMLVLLKSMLPTDNITVHHLTKRDANMDKISFISFKVGIPISLKDVAFQSTTWPST